jgi:hypothetical protein
VCACVRACVFLKLGTAAVEQRSLQSALRHGAGRVRGALTANAGPPVAHPGRPVAESDRASISRLRYMALREDLQMDRAVHVHKQHRPELISGLAGKDSA